MRTLTKSNTLRQSAFQVLANGVTSNFRFRGAANTRYLERGHGAHIWDVDGNEYIDFRLGYRPNILGRCTARGSRYWTVSACRSRCRDILPEPDAREPWFLCEAHTHTDVTETANALEDVIKEVVG